MPFAGLEAAPEGRGGRFDVGRDFTIAGFPGSWSSAISRTFRTRPGPGLPQLGSVALQSGLWAAKNVLAEIAGKPRAPFVYDDKGFMAMINRNDAIVELGAKRHELHGHLAVAAWVGVQTYLMTGARNRLDAVVELDLEPLLARSEDDRPIEQGPPRMGRGRQGMKDEG